MDRLLVKSFGHFYCANHFPDIPEGKGLLLLPNHMSWWDGFFADYICRKLHDRLFHVMMLEEQLRRFWFFRKVGAFSINPADRASTAETMCYANDVLNAGSVVVMFPQGVLEPYDRRPFRLKESGLRMICGGGAEDFMVMPVGLKICYFTERYPDIICRFGDPIAQGMAVSDFPLFSRLFSENIAMLDQASYNRTFEGDLFRWRI
jgi:1-acyl-sn-glycerol-3-phosphate acyltransferase